ncbi:hypothetical protein ABFA07_008812 [Porites harrisoni]
MCLAFQSNRKCCHQVRSLVEGVGAEKFVSPKFESFIPKNTYISSLLDLSRRFSKCQRNHLLPYAISRCKCYHVNDNYDVIISGSRIHDKRTKSYTNIWSCQREILRRTGFFFLCDCLVVNKISK